MAKKKRILNPEQIFEIEQIEILPGALPMAVVNPPWHYVQVVTGAKVLATSTFVRCWLRPARYTAMLGVVLRMSEHGRG